ncbi:MAG: hypothetical protein QOE72_3815, partial [Chloroflexota bacterium]|nr:hypothetical protein [Chloroflexota bacterium]
MWSDSIHSPAFKRNFVQMLGSVDVSGLSGIALPEYPQG